MSLGFRSTGNVLDNATVAHGMNVSDIPGDGGAGPSGFVVTLSVEGLSPGTGTVEITSPTTIVASASGADGSGNLSVQVTWFNSGDDITFAQAGGGNGAFPDGFWAQAQLIRGVVTPASSQIGFDIQFNSADVLSFNSDLTKDPSNPSHSNDTWDGNKGSTNINFDFSNNSETPNSFVITRDGVPIASIPNKGVGSYTYTDTVFAPGTYSYAIAAYKYPNSISGFTTPFSVVFGGPPTFEIIGSGGFDLGGGAIFGFLVDPSGIYKLTVGKTHDTLYTDVSVSNATTNVAIP